MSMCLAAILGFFAWLTPPVAALPAYLQQASQETPAPPEAAPSSPAPAGTTPAGSQPDAGPESKPASPSQPAPVTKKAESNPAGTPQSEPPESKSPPANSANPASPTTATKKRRHKKHVAATPAAVPEKKVVHNGGTADPVVQIAPGMSAEQASSQRQNTTQLLAATDDRLKQISTRTLDSTQQDSISQIRKYMQQAMAAEQAGDEERAHNLASKALLLSDDLAKQ